MEEGGCMEEGGVWILLVDVKQIQSTWDEGMRG